MKEKLNKNRDNIQVIFVFTIFKLKKNYLKNDIHKFLIFH